MTRQTTLSTVLTLGFALFLGACSQNDSSPMGPAAAAETLTEQGIEVSTMQLFIAASGENSLTLAWSEVAGAATYEVLYMPADAAFGWTRQSGPGDFPAQQIEGLASCSKTYVRVRALDALGNALAISDVDSCDTECPQTVPAAPSELIASTNETHAISGVFRDNSDNEDSFEVLYMDLTAFDLRWQRVTVAAEEGSGQLVTFSIDGLTPGHEYAVRAIAVNSAGSSKMSNGDLGKTALDEADEKLESESESDDTRTSLVAM